MSSKRIEYLDIAKGFGIFCIVIGHNAVPQWLTDWVYSFHVPLFFILSGFFYKQRTAVETISKLWRQLLRPMLITILVAQFLIAFLFLRSGAWGSSSFNEWLIGVMTLQAPGYTRGMWFLMTLCWGKIWFHWIDRCRDVIQLIVVLILFVIGYYLFHNMNPLPWVFLRGMMVPLFLWTGIQIAHYNVFERCNTMWHFSIALLIVSLAWLSRIDLAGYELPHGVMSVITMIVVPIAVVVVLKWFANVSSLPRQLFSYAGQNSLFILCVHSLIHTWQFDTHCYNLLPSIGYVHSIWSWGVFGFFECAFLVFVVWLLNKWTLTNRIFHGF